MTAKEIEVYLAKDRILAGHPLVCPNVNFLLTGQNDLISVNRSGLLIEYEIKISRADFFRDAKKNKGQSFINSFRVDRTPNQFYYVVPIGLVEMEEIPSWAGLMYVNDKGIPYSKKKAPMIHTKKHDLLTIYKKITTLYQQRHFFGECLMTHNNRKSREAWKKLNESE